MASKPPSGTRRTCRRIFAGRCHDLTTYLAQRWYGDGLQMRKALSVISAARLKAAEADNVEEHPGDVLAFWAPPVGTSFLFLDFARQHARHRDRRRHRPGRRLHHRRRGDAAAVS